MGLWCERGDCDVQFVYDCVLDVVCVSYVCGCYYGLLDVVV